MKRTTIITAKILDYYAELIERGVKRYEVRSGSLEAVVAICFVSAKTGTALGTYEVLRTLCFARDADTEVMGLAQTTPEQFYDLFPMPKDGGPERLWAAEIGKRTSFESLLGLEAGSR